MQQKKILVISCQQQRNLPNHNTTTKQFVHLNFRLIRDIVLKPRMQILLQPWKSSRVYNILLRQHNGDFSRHYKRSITEKKQSNNNKQHHIHFCFTDIHLSYLRINFEYQHSFLFPRNLQHNHQQLHTPYISSSPPLLRHHHPTSLNENIHQRETIIYLVDCMLSGNRCDFRNHNK